MHPKIQTFKNFPLKKIVSYLIKASFLGATAETGASIGNMLIVYPNLTKPNELPEVVVTDFKVEKNISYGEGNSKPIDKGFILGLKANVMEFSMSAKANLTKAVNVIGEAVYAK